MAAIPDGLEAETTKLRSQGYSARRTQMNLNSYNFHERRKYPGIASEKNKIK